MQSCNQTWKATDRSSRQRFLAVKVGFQVQLLTVLLCPLFGLCISRLILLLRLIELRCHVVMGRPPMPILVVGIEMPATKIHRSFLTTNGFVIVSGEI